jgi:hypothetical protein
MRWAVSAAVLLALAAPRPGRAASPADALSAEERDACSAELAVVDKRRKVFEAEGLSAAEIARRNEVPLQAVRECRDRARADARREAEQREDVAEAARRAGPNATPLERDRAWREVRLERLSAKPSSQLTAEEKAELAAGTGDELKATHAALDEAHRRDPAFMRVVYSAVACYHGARKEELGEAISSEERMLKLGTGDRQRLYALKSELRQTQDVLARNAEALRGVAGGAERCAAQTIAVVAHCLGVRLTGTRAEPACESETIQQYVRFAR